MNTQTYYVNSICTMVLEKGKKISSKLESRLLTLDKKDIFKNNNFFGPHLMYQNFTKNMCFYLINLNFFNRLNISYYT